MFRKLITNTLIIITIVVIIGWKAPVVCHSDRSSHNQYPALTSPDHCYRPSKCRPLNTSQCLDVTLPYKYTTDSESQPFYEIHDYLNRWKGLRSIPQCWKALQSVLCATFFPRCDNETGKTALATHEMCKLTRQPCRLIEQHHHWPEFLRCDNESQFPFKCKNVYTDLKFNTTGVATKCSPPLVNTDDQNIWYPGIEGCALNCLDPIYTAAQHANVHQFVWQGSTVSLLATLASVATFIIDWRSSNRYPAVFIFYMNMCLLIADIGWLLPSVFTKGHLEVVCRPDNTSRYGEPGYSDDNNQGSSFKCLVSFTLIYYFSMAALVWFVNLAYAWNLLFQASGASNRESVNAKRSYFHIVAWSIPLVLWLTIMFLGEVDGDSLRGICFVGVLKPVMRICFVLVPITIALIIGCYYMFKAMRTLIRVKLMNKTQKSLNRRKSKKIEHMIIRIGLFVLFAITVVIITYISHIHEFTHLSDWKKSLNDYILCTLNITAALYPEMSDSTDTSVQSCKLVDRPNLMYTYIQLIAVFGAGICSSSWVWTSNSIASWKRFLRRRLKTAKGPIRLKPHEVIRKTFNHRHQLTQGCYSPSFNSVHNDPVDMTLNSAVSQDLSATWTTALPNLMHRRGGIVTNYNDPTTGQTTHYIPTYVGNGQSSNSDISQQHISYDSFRRSMDSQYSLEAIEMVNIDRHQRRKCRKERDKQLKNSLRSKPYRRRGSDTSGSLISAALPWVHHFNPCNKSECKSTSTGDLIQLANNQMQNLIAHPFIRSPIATPSSIQLPSHPVLPFMAPTAIPRPRAMKPLVTNFTFTHGMSDQSSQLTNPLLEKRRPDSCAPYPPSQVPNTTPNGTRITPQQMNTSNSNLQLTGQASNAMTANFGLTYMYGMNSGINGSLNYMTNPQSLNYYQPMNTFYGNLLVNSQTQSYPNYMSPAYPSTPLPNMPFPYPPYPQFASMAAPAQQQCNLQDMMALMREREAYLPLFRPMESASEVEDNILPIQLSDSEGIYSPDGLSRNEGLITTQQEVNQHMQQVVAAAEANGVANGVANGHNQTIVGALGEGPSGNVLEVNQSVKNKKSDSKRKKKKRKDKINNNMNAINNHLNETEEQNPLLLTESESKVNNNNNDCNEETDH